MSLRRHRHHSSSRRPSNRGRNLVFLIGLAAVIAVAIAIPLALSSPPPSQGVTATATGATVQATQPAPGDSGGLPLPELPSMVPVGQSSFAPEPSPNASDGPGIVARRIRIPSLSIDLPIVPGDGLDVPLYKAGHYPGSGWPGGGSNIYLYAHARDGMFINLWDARVGDQVFLDLVDGTTRTYTVDAIMRNVAWNDLQLLDPTPSEQLTLQTCVSYGETAPRFVVIAHPSS